MRKEEKEEEEETTGQNIMSASASATQGGHKKILRTTLVAFSRQTPRFLNDRRTDMHVQIPGCSNSALVYRRSVKSFSEAT